MTSFWEKIHVLIFKVLWQEFKRLFSFNIWVYVLYFFMHICINFMCYDQYKVSYAKFLWMLIYYINFSVRRKKYPISDKKNSEFIIVIHVQQRVKGTLCYDIYFSRKKIVHLHSTHSLLIHTASFFFFSVVSLYLFIIPNTDK